MGKKIKVVIGGINGKMGRASAKAILGDPEMELVGAFGKHGAVYVGEDVGDFASTLKTGILVSDGFLDIFARVQPDVYLDFTRAEAALEFGKQAIDLGVRPVIGTSGLGEKEQTELSELAASRKVGGIIVPNFSVGAVLMMEFARQAAELFSHVEVVEMHYTKKVDAPSGTAMHTVNKLASSGRQFNAKEVDEKELLPGARGGQGEGGVRVHSLRLPGLISHQEVIFGSDGELLTIRHDSFNTNCFMKGVLMAIKAVMGMDRLAVGLDKLLALDARQPAKQGG